MENTFTDKWTSFTKDTINASKELEDINSKVLDKVTESQISVSSALFEANTDFLENLGATKKYPDLLTTSNKLLNSYSEVFSIAATNAGDLLKTARSDYEEWVKKGIEKSVSAEFLNTPTPFKNNTSKTNTQKKAPK